MNRTYKYLTVSQPTPFVTHVRLNRPERLNALNKELFYEIRDVFNELAVDENTRAAILSGNGRSFCAGLDLKENLLVNGAARDGSVDVARTARRTREEILSLQRAFAAIRECPKPVIAAIHGHCLGGGVDLAAWCDIRWATADATFSVREVDLGLAGDIGSLTLLPKICGNASWIREIAYTGRIFPADEALQHGLISKVLPSNDDLLKAADNFAANLASKSPVALQGTKLVLNYSSDHTVCDSLTYVAHWNMSQLLTEDIPKAAHALLTKQAEPPLFAKL